MSDPNQYNACLAQADIIKTLVAMQAQDGIDIVFVEDETHGGTPYLVVTVQGQFVPMGRDWAETLAKEFARLRQAAKDEAEQN